MINMESTLFHGPFEIPIAQGIGQIPEYALENHFPSKMPSFKADQRLSWELIVMPKAYHAVSVIVTEPS